MSHFLIYNFTLILLYPTKINIYLINLPHITTNLNTNKTQLHITFSIYLTKITTTILFTNKITNHSKKKPITIPNTTLFIITSIFYSLTKTNTLFLTNQFLQKLNTNYYYIITFTILHNTLNNQRQTKILSLLNNITYIIPILTPILKHLIILKFP